MKKAVLLLGLFAVATSVGCKPDQQIIVPNRVLDRPLDVALTCMKVTEAGEVEALSVSACDRPTTVSCGTREETQLIAFITNSERNEVAMARRCDTTAAVVDMDGDSPGYQLIPVGQLPSHIAATELGCRVVTSNAGSCDLSVLEATGLAGYALELPPPDAPAALVSRLKPLRSDGIPLGTRPGVVISVPDELSLAGENEGEPIPEPGDESGGASESESGDESGGADTGAAPPPLFSQCPPGKAESLWVTFPTCQLVAELSLNTGQILQSRRFITQPDGSVVVEDGGTAPDCPIDCPIAFEDGLPPTCGEGEGETDTDTDGDTDGDTDTDGATADCREALDPDGFFPTALTPVTTFELGEDATVAPYPALFVGGLGSDTIFEIQFEGEVGEETGQWVPAEDSQELTLQNADGVHAIRATPVLDGIGRQFLYVIAGDGSTHVVERFFDRGTFGNECDTQIDPSVPRPDPLCNAIPPGASGQTPSPERRPFAVGPGIRASLGAAITDWTFFKLTEENFQGDVNNPEEGNPWTPFDTPGVIGVGVTSFGRVVLSVFDQLIDQETYNATLDPVGVMDLSVSPHGLWPSLDPLGADPLALPLVDDVEPDRVLPGAEDTPQVLSPSLRRIDLAYSDAPSGEELSDERQALADALGNPTNTDELGRFDGTGIYETEVARVAVRDYAQWRPLQWSMVWEGTIPSSRSTTGRFACDTPGWENGTCVPKEDGVSRLIDESTSFCDLGVLPGDKLVLLPCSGDDDCGLGQKCLHEPTAPSSTGGICVSSQDYEDNFQVLRDVCAPFINDPCGTPRLEYLVTDAFQNELWIRPMDIPLSSHLVTSPRFPDEDNDEDFVVAEFEDRFTCALPYSVSGVPIFDAVRPDGTCSDDNDCRGGSLPARCVLDATGAAGRCESLATPGCDPADVGCEPGCFSDEDCPSGEDGDHLCIDRICRGPCTGGDPDCFECADDTECGHYGPLAICSDNRCMRPCESGDPDCTLARLPGPRCFPELVEYVVRLRESFMVEGAPDVLFIPDRVIPDPTTGRCREDPTASTLLTSRLRLGADEAETFGGALGYPYVIPECPNVDEASPSDPNPCRITRPRAEDEGTLFHTFTYGTQDGTQDVAAVRFSNPFMSVVLDLTDLRSLASEVEQFPDKFFGDEFSQFRRGRIPQGYRETFTAIPGYVPFSEPVIVSSTVLVYPVRIVPGPELGVAFIVDAGGRGGPAGVRGQLIRIVTSAIAEGGMEDLSFLVR